MVVALCSKSADPREAVWVGEQMGTVTIALDVESVDGVLPEFETSRLLAGTMFAFDSDLSTKRNLGLLLARAAGLERILFLDDDMWVPNPQDAKVAAGLLDRYRAVGLYNVGFPDHSVVCRVHREIGGEQEQFIGAGALVVSPPASKSFFPDIYCEDWFYFLSENEPPHLGRAGTVAQRRYHPFDDPCRPQREELGDTLAEGLYWLLDEGQQPVLDHADASFWADFIDRRRRFIVELRKVVRRENFWDKRAVSLKQALDVSEEIGPELCLSYLDAWRADRAKWWDFVSGVRPSSGGGIEGALDRLGLAGVTYLP